MLLRKKPSECDLGRRCFLLLGKFADQIYQRLIRVAILRREAGNDIAEIAFFELCVLADRSGEQTLSQGLNGTKPMPSSSSVGIISFSGKEQPLNRSVLISGSFFPLRR